MSDSDASVVHAEVLVPAESNHSFLTDRVDLKSLLTGLKKHTKDAIEVLVAMMKSPDEKVKLQAATKLLEFQVQVAKEINADQMQRLIAEIKLAGAGTKKTVNLVPEEERPLVDFNNIREIE